MRFAVIKTIKQYGVLVLHRTPAMQASNADG